jgi:hypothetical protein
MIQGRNEDGGRVIGFAKFDYLNVELEEQLFFF